MEWLNSSWTSGNEIADLNWRNIYDLHNFQGWTILKGTTLESACMSNFYNNWWSAELLITCLHSLRLTGKRVHWEASLSSRLQTPLQTLFGHLTSNTLKTHFLSGWLVIWRHYLLLHGTSVQPKYFRVYCSQTFLTLNAKRWKALHSSWCTFESHASFVPKNYFKS